VFVTFVVVVVVILIGALLWTRRGGNKGERDITGSGVNDVGQGGAERPNTPRGGNAAGR